jgi:hypothetical protein
MPNGFHHRDDLDIISIRHTSQGYPELRTREVTGGFRAITALGHRGYAPLLDWSQFVEPELPRKKVVSRADVEALAERYVTAIHALLVANEEDALHPSMRRGSLAWLGVECGWAIAIGQFQLYGRRDGRFVHLPTLPSLPVDLPPQLFRSLITSEINGEGLVPAEATAAGCVVSLEGCGQLLCTSQSVHHEPEWSAIALGAIDDPTAIGSLVQCLLRRGREAERDAFVVRCRLRR